jgi:hypothetical protein
MTNKMSTTQISGGVKSIGSTEYANRDLVLSSRGGDLDNFNGLDRTGLFPSPTFEEYALPKQSSFKLKNDTLSSSGTQKSQMEAVLVRRKVRRDDI